MQKLEVTVSLTVHVYIVYIIRIYRIICVLATDKLEQNRTEQPVDNAT